MSLYRRAISIGASGQQVPVSTWADFVWPMYEVDGNRPTISDGYGKDKRGGKGHFGVDIMRKRPSKDQDMPGEYRGGKNVKAPWFYMREDDYALNVGPGRIYDVRRLSNGIAIRVDHKVDGKPILTVHRHLRSVAPGVKAGVIVGPGVPLGLIGDDPSNAKDPPHDHFEIWDTSKARKYPDWTLDPEPVMKSWGFVRKGNFEQGIPNRVVPGPAPTSPGKKSGNGPLLAVVAALFGMGAILQNRSRSKYV